MSFWSRNLLKLYIFLQHLKTTFTGMENYIPLRAFLRGMEGSATDERWIRVALNGHVHSTESVILDKQPSSTAADFY